MVEQNLDALRRIGVYPGDDERGLVLVPGAAAAGARRRAPGAARARAARVRAGASGLALALQVLAARAHGGADRRHRRRRPARWSMTGAPDERERALNDGDPARRSRRRRARRRVDLTGQLSLSELAALTARARAFAGVDSAPMHIAAAVGTPALALFGPSSEIAWGPWQVPQRVSSRRRIRAARADSTAAAAARSRSASRRCRWHACTQRCATSLRTDSPSLAVLGDPRRRVQQPGAVPRLLARETRDHPPALHAAGRRRALPRRRARGAARAQRRHHALHARVAADEAAAHRAVHRRSVLRRATCGATRDSPAP